MSRLISVAVFVLLFLVSPAMADTIHLKSGATIEAKVLEVTDDAVIFTLDGLEGSRITIPQARISDYSLYEIRRARIDGKSVAEREALGDWALERGLLAFAMEEYGKAVRLSGKEVAPALRSKLEDASNQCGADKLSRAKALVDEGRLEDARNFLRDILKNHPTCPAAKVAGERVDVLKAQIKKRKEDAKKQVAIARTTKKVEDGLLTAKDLIERGARQRRLGLTESGSLRKVENAYLAAVESYAKAETALKRARKLPAAEAKKAEFGALDEELAKRRVEVYVDLGHTYVLKGNLLKANKYMGLALATDPNDPNALALRSAITAATSNDRWGRPGG